MTTETTDNDDSASSACYAVEFWGGYDGDQGSVTAFKTYRLPFVPYNGLVVDTELGTVSVDDKAVMWSVRRAKFTAHVTDFRYNDGATLDALMATLEKHGWEITDTDWMTT